MKRRRWTNKQLTDAVASSRSIRQVINKLGLIPAGGNYKQVYQYIDELKLDTTHLKGKCWNKGMSGVYFHPQVPLDEILIQGRKFQSYGLKNRLYKARLKKKECEKCGWAEVSKDGRMPLELHHMNGDHTDNRLENLVILCPNCHSLEPNYRGRKK
jgi:Zn finger protein HypA/HybF involved in hydrogenase expression